VVKGSSFRSQSQLFGVLGGSCGASVSAISSFLPNELG
jgi:hypothetical protein